MKILITGATGLVGSVLVNHALKQGYHIHYLTTRRHKTDIIEGATGFFWDPANNEIDLECFKGVNAIIHLAGASISKRWTKRNKDEIKASRIDSSNLLYTSLSRLDSHQIKTILAASAIGVYPSSYNKVYTEDFSPNPSTFLENVVVAWEGAVDQFKKIKINVVKLRIGLVLTPKGGLLGPLKLPTQFGLGCSFGSGNQIQSWIHVDDVVHLFLFALEREWSGVYNAVAPNPINQQLLMKTLAKAMKRPFFMPPIPRFLIDPFVGEMSTLIFNSQHVSADKVIQAGFSFEYPDLLPAIKSLLKK